MIFFNLKHAATSGVTDIDGKLDEGSKCVIPSLAGSLPLHPKDYASDKRTAHALVVEKFASRRRALIRSLDQLEKRYIQAMMVVENHPSIPHDTATQSLHARLAEKRQHENRL